MDNKELKKDKIIKNIIFDIGNVILNFNVDDVLQKFTSDRNEQKFILDNIINSPEWLGNALIDTGYITRENAIEIVKDRTNHVYDNLIPSESVFIDDNQNNITTGNSLGIISKKVEPDNYDSIVNIINELNLM